MADNTRAAARARRSAKIALFFLWASFAAVAYNIYSEVAELALIDHLEAIGDEYTDDTLARIDANEERQRNARVGYVIALGLSTIALLVWVSRTNRACRELGATDMEFTPGWAWGVWLIPIINLFRPYQVVRELWRTTDIDRRESGLVLGWWLVWIGSGFVSRFGGEVTDPNASLDEFRRVDYYWLFSHAVDIVAYALAIVVVSKLARKLDGFAERQTAAKARVV